MGSGSTNTVNANYNKQYPDTIQGMNALSTWYATSSKGVEYGTASVHPHDRQFNQLSFTQSVYSFEVKEDTVPGKPQ